jgi:hypothetical protein
LREVYGETSRDGQVRDCLGERTFNVHLLRCRKAFIRLEFEKLLNLLLVKIDT